jgi:hypothetical protein
VAAGVQPRPAAQQPGVQDAGGVRVVVPPVRLRFALPDRGHVGDVLTDSHADWPRERGQVTANGPRGLLGHGEAVSSPVITPRGPRRALRAPISEKCSESPTLRRAELVC